MVVKKLDETAGEKNALGILVQNLYSSQDAVVSVMTLEPGKSLKPHTSPVDVVFFVLMGSGVVQIGDEKQEVGKHTLIESPREILHGWENHTDQPLRFVLIKAPRP